MTKESGETLPTHSLEPKQSPRKLSLRARIFFCFLGISLAMLLHLRPSVSAAASRLRHVGCGALRANHTLGGLPSHYTLPSGDKIPSVALGVWQAPPDEVGGAVRAALKAGYRHIDGAWIYGNEKEVGKVIQESNVKREDLWLTSKLWNTFHNPDDVEGAVDQSLKSLGVDYLDLYIIHWPIAFNGDKKRSNGKPEIDEVLTADPYPTWKAMEELVLKGKVRNIGVSNFNVARLRNLTANPLRLQPAVNQVELSFWNPQPELLSFAKSKHLLLEAYSPLGSGKLVGRTLGAPAVKEVAAEMGVTPAQVIISWHVQRGTVVLPKSVTPSRVVENLHITKLPQALFDKVEKAATSHEPERAVNPSKGWGVGYDIFDEYPYKN